MIALCYPVWMREVALNTLTQNILRSYDVVTSRQVGNGISASILNRQKIFLHSRTLEIIDLLKTKHFPSTLGTLRVPRCPQKGPERVLDLTETVAVDRLESWHHHGGAILAPANLYPTVPNSNPLLRSTRG